MPNTVSSDPQHPETFHLHSAGTFMHPPLSASCTAENPHLYSLSKLAINMEMIQLPMLQVIFFHRYANNTWILSFLFPHFYPGFLIYGPRQSTEQ